MRFWMSLQVVLALFVGVVPPAWADCSAANLSVSKTTRSLASHQDPVYAYFISREDCLDGDVFTFPYEAQNVGTKSLEAWAAPNSSVDCTDPTTRDGTVGPTKCVRIADPKSSPTTLGTIMASAKTIAGAIDGVSGCDYTGSGTAPIPTNIYFMLVQGAAAAVTKDDACIWSATSVDLVGPPPPTNVTAVIGDSIATLSYDASPADVVGYDYFCDTTPGGSGGTGGGTTSVTTGTSMGGGPTCPSTALFADRIPDLSYACGKTNGVSGNATGLTNGASYAIGVAAYDSLGNVGELSNVVCITPGPVDHPPVHRDAGGCVLAGPASSALGVSNEGSGLPALLSIAGVTILRRRRSRRPLAKASGRSSV